MYLSLSFIYDISIWFNFNNLSSLLLQLLITFFASSTDSGYPVINVANWISWAIVGKFWFTETILFKYNNAFL